MSIIYYIGLFASVLSLKHCIKILFISVTKFIWHSLIFCTQGHSQMMQSVLKKKKQKTFSPFPPHGDGI